MNIKIGNWQFGIRSVISGIVLLMVIAWFGLPATARRTRRQRGPRAMAAHPYR